MAGALVLNDQGSSGAPSNGLYSLTGNTFTSGNLNFGAGVYRHSSQLATAMTDTFGSLYTQLIDIYDATSSYGLALFAAKNLAGGSGDVTFKCGTGGSGTTPSGGRIGAALAEFSGLHVSSPFTPGETAYQAQAAPGGAANAISTGNLPVLAVQPGLVIGISMNVSNTVPSNEEAGNTFVDNLWSFGVSRYAIMSFKRVTSTAAVPLRWTNATGGSDRHLSLAVFLNETGAVILRAPTMMLMGVG